MLHTFLISLGPPDFIAIIKTPVEEPHQIFRGVYGQSLESVKDTVLSKCTEMSGELIEIWPASDYTTDYLSYEAFRKKRSTYYWYGRHALVDYYGWAIPNKIAIDTISKFSPIVEIGAGRGYWTGLLRNNGADVIAYDAWHRSYRDKTWTEIKTGGPRMVTRHQEIYWKHNHPSGRVQWRMYWL